MLNSLVAFIIHIVNIYNINIARLNKIFPEKKTLALIYALNLFIYLLKLEERNKEKFHELFLSN